MLATNGNEIKLFSVRSRVRDLNYTGNQLLVPETPYEALFRAMNSKGISGPDWLVPPPGLGGVWFFRLQRYH